LSKIFGIVILFAAAWLMVRLQAGSGSCCGGSHDRSASDTEHGQSCCGEPNMASAVDKENKIEN